MEMIDLVEHWQKEAVGLRAIGEYRAAEHSELHAFQLRAWLGPQKLEKLDGNDLLTVSEAAARSGLSSGYLRNLLCSGVIPNAGDRSHPRIRVEDLPRRKRRRRRLRSRHVVHDPAAGILSLFGPEGAAASGR